MGQSRTTHAGRAPTEKQDRFVRLIAQGVSNREACGIVGVNRRTGTRWRLGRTIRNTAGEAVHYPPVRILTPSKRHPRYFVVGRADGDRRPAAGEAHRARDRGRVGSFPGDDQQGASAQRRRSRPLSAPQRGPGGDRTQRTAACPTRDGRYRTAGRGGGTAGQAVESGTGRARAAPTVRRPACPAPVHRVDLPGDLRPRRARYPPSQDDAVDAGGVASKAWNDAADSPR